MASDVVSEAIKGYLTEQWVVGGQPRTPIQFENEAEVTTTDAAGASIHWIMMEISGNVYAQQSIGAGPQRDNRWDEDGQLFLHVFAPAGAGSQVARGHAKALADIFRGAQLLEDSLTFEDASIGLGEPGDANGKWWRVSVSVDWVRNEA